jgi:hypothetical protein
MITITALQTALLDLLQKIRYSEIKLIIGGGFGIYLKTNHVKLLDMRTLLDQWPEPRSTNDLDLFLRNRFIKVKTDGKRHYQPGLSGSPRGGKLPVYQTWAGRH